MSKLAHSCDETMEQIEINAMFAHDSAISESEAYEILFDNDVPVERVPFTYQDLYMRWQYLNIK